MIHEEICTYEVCKLAKEKGFPQDVFGTCEMKSACYLEDGRFYKDGCIYPIENAYSAPTQSLLQRWLREEKGIHISVEYEWVEGIDGWTFWAYIKQVKDERVIDDAMKSGFNTYELALEDALAYSLKNLV